MQGDLSPISYDYNEKGQLIKVAQGNRSTIFSYNAKGLLTVITNALGQQTRFTYNLNGHPVSMTYPNGEVMKFRYNVNNLLAALTTTDGRPYTHGYNENSMLTNFKEPQIDDKIYHHIYSYNLDDDLVRTMLPNTSIIANHYNARGLLTKVSGTDFERTMTYGANGLIKEISWNTTDKMIFDGDEELYRSIIWQGTIKGKIGYEWGAFDRLSVLRLNDMEVARYTYLPEGSISKVNDLTFIYNPKTGLPIQASISSISSSYQYSNFGELADMVVNLASSELLSVHLERDALGRIITRTKNIKGNTTVDKYEYDAKGQIISVTENGKAQTYSYNRNGNRLTATGQEVYDNQDRLISDVNWIYTYQYNGWLQRREHKTNGSSDSFNYDDLGNLIAVKKSDGTLIEYKSDGLNRRYIRSVNGVFSYGLLYQDGLHPIAQVDQNGSIVATFIYGSIPNSPDLMIKDGVTYRFIHDHLGSVLFVINTKTNEIAQEIAYDTWGQVLSDSNPGFQPFGFAGGLYDNLTGLVRFGARDYDPSAGRWMDKDPIRFKGGQSNFYLYVGNDPVNNIDPQGLWAGSVIGAVVGGVTGAIQGAASGCGSNAIIGAVTGGIVGAASGAFTGNSRLIGSAIGAVSGLAAEAANQSISGSPMNIKNLATAAVTGAIGGYTGNMVGNKMLQSGWSAGASTITGAIVGGENSFSTGVISNALLP
jgi:RHS repeat-associated protein